MLKLNELKITAQIFCKLLKSDLLVFKKSLVSITINTVVWIGIMLAVHVFIFPLFGMWEGFGVFSIVGQIVSYCIFDVMNFTWRFAADLEGKKVFSHSLTVPIPSWMVFVKNAVLCAIRSSFVGIMILPYSKLVLWNIIVLPNFCLWRFVLMFFAINLFFGFFTLLITGFVHEINKLEAAWVRVLFPLWFLGGAGFRWEMVYNFAPKLSYICLLNPIIYAMEGIRVAAFGQPGYLPFWLCLTVMLAGAPIAGGIGIWKLRRLLDFV
jgi:hypothetical protein